MLITALGYLGVSSPRSEDWRVFGTEFLGAELAEDGPDGAVRLRIDDVDWRLQIHPGETDKTEYFGWLVNVEEDLDTVIERLKSADIGVEWGSDELAVARGVNKLVVFTDPWGFRHEVAWGQVVTQVSSFRPGRAISGFVTGQQGIGHVLLFLPDIEAGHAFFSGLLGFELSDKIAVPGTPDRPGLNARFYHVNARHHSLAIAQGPPGVAGLNHLMLQLKELDDVGNAYDLIEKYDVPITLSLGRHSNDRMQSFYICTPSLFNIEYGYDGVEITPDWVPRTYRKTAIWGHTFHPDARNRPPGIMHTIA